MATAQSNLRRSTPPDLAPERAVIWPPRTVRTLANGLQVVLVESHTIPKITVDLYFRSGNAATMQEAPGLAEIAAAVVRTGTASRSSHQIEDDLRRMGADLSTGASSDSSSIAISGLAEFSRPLLEMMADLARNASFPANEFERERRQKLEEVRIERATPGFLAGERLRRILFGAHPYAVISPTEEQVHAYRREQLIAFQRAHYVPGNALLIAVGDFSAAAMLGEIESVFGEWTAPLPAKLGYPEPPVPRGRRVHLVHMPGTVQTQITVGNHAITRAHPDWLRLSLANAIYGGAFNSRLVINIREQKGYTYSPRSAAHALRERGFFSTNAAVRNDVVAATLTEIFYELDRMRALPVAGDELSDARHYLSGVFSLGLATQDGLAGQLATAFLSGLPEDYLETYRDRIRALTADDVLTAARRYFDSANSQIVVVGDRDHVGDQAALFGDLEVVDALGRPL